MVRDILVIQLWNQRNLTILASLYTPSTCTPQLASKSTIRKELLIYTCLFRLTKKMHICLKNALVVILLQRRVVLATNYRIVRFADSFDRTGLGGRAV
jgi:hypothetical protein